MLSAGTTMRRSFSIAFCLGLSGCFLRPAAPPQAVECTTKAKAKYDGTSAKAIEERLRQESARVNWDAVSEPYRAWAAERLDQKLSAAGVTLASSGNCKEIEAAASKVTGLAKRIAEVAKECTEPQCVAKSAKQTEIDAKLEAALCPLFPFC
jgi:hypothetical protein